MINFSRGMIQSLRRSLAASGSSNSRPPKNPVSLTQATKNEEAIRRFRPSEGEWLGRGLLLTFLHCLVVWGLLALLTPLDLDTVAPGDRLLRVVLFPVLFLAAFYRGRWLEEHERKEIWWVRLVKYGLVLALARLFPYLANPGELIYDLAQWRANSVTFFDWGFVINLSLLAWTVLSGEKFARRLLRFYVRPQEILLEKGGTAYGSTGWINRPLAYREFRSRLVFGGFLLATVLGIYAVLLNERGPSNNQPLIIGFIISYIVLALLVLSWTRLRYLRTIWQLGELAEPVQLRPRWNGYLLGLGLTLGLLALALPRNADLKLPEWQLNLDWLRGNPQPREGSNGRPPPQPNGQEGQRPRALEEPFRLPDWVWQMLLVLLVVIALVVIIWLLKKAGWFGPNRPRLRWPKLHLARWWQGVVGAVGRWLAWVASLFRWRKRPKTAEEATVAAKGSWFRRGEREQLPADPRELVRYHYRQTLRKAARAGVPRQPAQTPQEYAGYVQERLAEGSAVPPTPDPRQDIESLNAAYQEARFSPHPISPAQASEASQHASRLETALRQVRRANRPAKPKGKQKK